MQFCLTCIACCQRIQYGIDQALSYFTFGYMPAIFIFESLSSTINSHFLFCQLIINYENIINVLRNNF